MWIPIALLSLGLAPPVATQDEVYDPARFEREVLATSFDRPMELEVTTDGRIFVVEQGGKVQVYDPATNAVSTALELGIYMEQENGLLGIALDPDFDANGWLYLMYSPATHDGQVVSRFTAEGLTIDPASERVLLSWLEQRRECCHHGGSLEFGPEGNLFIATGDNTSPFASDGFNPIDERPDRYPFDAQRSAANTMNFAGKVLRIRPTPAGGYQIPPGNLFTDPLEGRPEIYVMGTRNSWRISIDPATGYLYWGDVGPDSGKATERGPQGYDEFNQAKRAGFFGWPYFIGDNFAYADWDFEHQHLGPKQDPARPINRSPNNSGARLLPPAQPAWIWYPYGESEEFPGVNPSGGRTACAGPAFHFDPDLDSPTQFPLALDGTLLLYEWSRSWVRVAHLEGDSELAALEPFPGEFEFIRPVDLQFGPEGELYVLEYGTTWGTNEDSRLSRIGYVRGNRAPIAKASADRRAGAAPLTIALSSEGTLDKDAEPLSYRWTLHPSGRELSTEAECEVVVEDEGRFIVQLEVVDPVGNRAVAHLPLAVGNEPPEVTFVRPVSGAFYDPSVPLEYEVRVVDLEDGESEGDSDLAWWMQNVFVTPHVLAAQPPGSDEASFDPPGLAAMKRSDCFNCHAVRQDVVGPSFAAVAVRAAEEPLTIEETVQRVRKGSAGRWGDAQMLPHSGQTDAELRAMVTWIFEQSTNEVAAAPRPGHFGALLPEELDVDGQGSGSLVLEASYTDTGGDAVGPLTGTARLVLRTLRVEAEHFSANDKNGRLDSDTASGGSFIGKIEADSWLRFDDMDLSRIANVVARVSSAGAGADVELRAGAPDGPLVAAFEMEPNGEWEEWFDVTVEVDWPGGSDTLFVLFRNPSAGGGLMNLDCLTFVPAKAGAGE